MVIRILCILGLIDVFALMILDIIKTTEKHYKQPKQSWESYLDEIYGKDE